MPKTTHTQPDFLGGWVYVEPILEKMAKKWPQKLPPAVLNRSTLLGPVMMAAREPQRLSAKGREQFWEAYSAAPDWILAVMTRIRAETVTPRSGRKALHAFLHANWMHDATSGEVVEELRREFPGLEVPRNYSGSNVDNARSQIRARQRALKKAAKS